MFSFFNPIPTLPTPSGSYNVGSTECEIPISDFPSESPIPSPDVTTIKFRIFYPTAATQSESDRPIWWLPEPQRQWLEAYTSFLGASSRLSKFVSYIPSLINYARIPAHPDVPILAPPASKSKYPVVIFSHGLGGSLNAYSSILTALASAGVVCVAPEHRDQSCPISIVRNPNGTTSSVHYLRLSHKPSPETLAARNRQLRIRLWELALLYTALETLNSGSCLNNLANAGATPSFKDKLDLSPSSVTWAGHSFGATSVLQLVKSVFWHQSLPNLAGTEHETDPDWGPLYTASTDSTLARQVTSSSAIVLLDLWTMPLRGDYTKWLFDKPLPCYADKAGSGPGNVVAVMSQEFYNWKELRERTRRILSIEPANDRCSDASQTRGEPSPRLFYAPKTAHLSQSDFGCLFPWVTRYLMKAEEPERTISLNVRAILQLLRERGLQVGSVQAAPHVGGEMEGEGSDDDCEILSSNATVEGWIPLSLQTDE